MVSVDAFYGTTAWSSSFALRFVWTNSRLRLFHTAVFRLCGIKSTYGPERYSLYILNSEYDWISLIEFVNRCHNTIELKGKHEVVLNSEKTKTKALQCTISSIDRVDRWCTRTSKTFCNLASVWLLLYLKEVREQSFRLFWPCETTGRNVFI